MFSLMVRGEVTRLTSPSGKSHLPAGNPLQLRPNLEPPTQRAAGGFDPGLRMRHGEPKKEQRAPCGKLVRGILFTSFYFLVFSHKWPPAKAPLI